MFKSAMVVISLAAAAFAASGAPTVDNSYLAAAAFGLRAYETSQTQDQEINHSYNVAFAWGADFYRHDGRVSHLVVFRYAGTESYNDTVTYREACLNYNLPVYFTTGSFQPAVRPYFGAHYLAGKGGGSQGEIGLLGGVRAVGLKRCNFSDVYFGWRGRYGSLPAEVPVAIEHWRSSLVLRNANTIHLAAHVCIYVIMDVEYDLTKDAAGERRKPTLALGIGPAAGW
jgi:hypothetical protein